MRDSSNTFKRLDSGSFVDSLAECQAFALACLPIAVSQCLADIAAEFTERPDGGDAEHEQARHALCKRKDDVVAGFHEHLAMQASGSHGRARAADGPHPDRLGLMLEDEHYDFTAPETLAAVIGAACSSELYSFDKRFEYLLGPSVRREWAFGPRAIGQAVMAALKAVGMPLGIRQQLLPGLVEHLPGNVGSVYRALNQAMIVRGVLPLMRAGSMVKAGDDALADMCWDWMSRHMEAAPDAAGTAPKHLLRWHSDAARLHEGLIAHGLEVEKLQAAGANLAREIEQAMSASLEAVDKVLLNWVAILFDGVFMRSDMDAAYRAVFSRLQWPMIKTALRDQGHLIDDVTHPAQRLFGAWVAAADARDAAGLARMQMLVAELSVAIQPDFAAAWRLWSADTPGEPPPLDAADAERYAAPIHAAISELRIPRAMASFLIEHRLAVLGGIASRHGEGGMAWRIAVDALDELLHSLEPASWRQDRAGLSASLPGTLKRLRASMEAAGVMAEARERFFGMLVKYHAILMKAAQGRPIHTID